ncbi:MazG family protein, partial [Nocardia neocaledoniensis]|uniref:MazG family protein n=1 Tax=Nocardia neocaledoniensis TaxID=236511 RepID=UPI002456B96F
MGEPSEAADTAVVAAGLAGAVEVMDRLWNFGGWETTQTHDSLRPYLLEETYELLDAIQTGDYETIKEELGDLLLQVLFHSRIAEAAGEFTVEEVAATLVDKLVHRSPHLVAADLPASTSVTDKIAAQEKAWEERKSAEKSRRSCLDGIAMAQPALALAEKVRGRRGGGAGGGGRARQPPPRSGERGGGPGRPGSAGGYALLRPAGGRGGLPRVGRLGAAGQAQQFRGDDDRVE